jgi:ABC-type multidrug transport system fused ATPase/permease subunit
MQEAALDQQWEMTLLRAQLRDAEDAIRALGPGDDEDAREEGEWPAPSSLLSLRRVSLNCKPGELVAVVGAVGSGKVRRPRSAAAPCM